MPFSGNPYDPKTPRPTYDADEITAEIRSFFATGVNLQELYIEPKFMTPRTWDVLAEAASWARRHSDVLADTHHIGGDPAKYEVYGWASWSPRKAIVALRNPDDRPAAFTLDVGRAFELPAGAAVKYVLRSPWKDEASPRRRGPGRAASRDCVAAVRGVCVRGGSGPLSPPGRPGGLLVQWCGMSILERFRLDGKKALVTGAGRGIGQRIASRSRML